MPALVQIKPVAWYTARKPAPTSERLVWGDVSLKLDHHQKTENYKTASFSDV